ncbi:group 1 truncated hemoglobin [Lacinutrix iliipiscaria]|uniref:Group 1 truncated hemoglobin n=1 Tax=Lacinutrix iliipiscaria TaxID=1230532 RepID=A0ABW5WKH5_9FLAO
MTTHQSLLHRLGGEDAVNAAVDLFYKKVLADDIINSYFKHTNMQSQAVKQKMFLSHVFGGKDTYNGKSLRQAHKYMKLENKHFEAVAKHLLATLHELKVNSDVIAEVALTVYKSKDDVLNIKT